MDSVQTSSGAIAVTGSRISTRSNRRRDSKSNNPKKAWQELSELADKKKSGFGVQELYKDHFKFDAHSCFAFFKPENAERNHHNEVFLYDHSRVFLRDWPHDYIHASWVDGVSKENQYILTQTPTAATIADFWRMCVQEKVEAIALLTKPDAEEAKVLLTSTSAGDFKVKFDSKNEKGTDVFSIGLSGKDKHSVKLFCCSSWTEDSKPPTGDIYRYRDMVAAASGKGPLVVTCSTGSARSAIFTLYDMEYERLKTKKRIKHTESVRKIRQKRCNAFDSFEVFDAGVLLLCDVAKRLKD